MKRLKKFLRRTAIVLLSVISVVILIFAFLNWRASRKVQSRLAPLRQSGKPISIQDMRPSPVSDQQNAAKVVLGQAAALRRFDRLLAQATNDAVTEAEWDVAAIRVAKNISQEFPDLNEALRSASEFPTYQPDIDYSTDPTELTEQFLNVKVSPRTIVRSLHGHGLMSLDDGDTDSAIKDAMAILNWSDHVAQQPLLINYSIGVACYGQGIDLSARCLYARTASPDARLKLIAACSDETRMLLNYQHSLDTERAFGIASFSTFPGSRLKHLLGELTAYLDVFEDFQTISRQPTGTAGDQPTTDGMFAGLVWPMLKESLNALRRKQSLSRSIRILAVWQDAGNDIDAALADLALPDNATIDPYDGSQMNLTVVGDTITVYSNGKNGIDDGGSLEDQRDIGIGPQDQEKGSEAK